jgi:hypothetical protein
MSDNQKGGSPALNAFNAVNEKMGKYRWIICGLLFFATTVNYMDRQVLSLLQPYLADKFQWTNSDYADITDPAILGPAAIKGRKGFEEGMRQYQEANKAAQSNPSDWDLAYKAEGLRAAMITRALHDGINPALQGLV